MKLRCFPQKNEFIGLCAKGNLVPVCMEILADTETPVTLLLKLNHGTKPLFLLESVRYNLGINQPQIKRINTDGRMKIWRSTKLLKK